VKDYILVLYFTYISSKAVLGEGEGEAVAYAREWVEFLQCKRICKMDMPLTQYGGPE
jgi:hypothetical protein